MRDLSIFMILIGALFLSLAFFPARKIWRNVSGQLRRKWLVILILMTFFLLGYILFDAVLFFSLPLPLELVTGGVFLGGAVFVFIIINLSQNTITAQQKAEEDIKVLNESLEQRVAERTWELKRLYDFNRIVLDSIADPISIIDVETFRIVDANQAFLKEFNNTEEQIVDRTCYEVTHHRSSPCTPPDDSCPLMDTLSHDNHATAQHVHWTLSGEKRYVEVLTSPIRDEKGKIVQAVHIQRDITERKQSEENLRESRELLRAIVEGTSDAIYVKDLAGCYRLFNSAASRLTGKSAEEVFGRDDTFLFPTDEARIVINCDRAVMDSGITKTYEEHLTSVDGKHMVFLATKGPLFDEHNNVTGIFGIARDITERNLAEKELNIAKEQAEYANRAKTVFLANMSHEIRTPMNGVIGMTQLLELTKLTKEQQEYADTLKVSGKNLLSLIDDILDLSKIEAGRIELEKINFDLQAETLGTTNLLSLYAHEKGLELVSLIDPDVPLPLKGDAGRLRQIFTNLIGNAIKFTPKGSVTLNIKKDCEDEGSVTLRFMIRDMGIGIESDKLSMIFDPFTQADDSTTRSYGGTGLGLTISRQLAELMGGSIGVESTKGVGSTFWFTAVFEKQSIPSIRTEKVETRSPGRIGVRRENLCAKSTRLLLAEDEPVNQMVVKSILVKLGYLVDVVSNGSEAIKALENNDYSLVLMDCMMPLLNGYEATAVIRDQTSAVRNHSIPVIALTANAFKIDRDNCLAADMDDYLSKPFDVAELQEILGKWMTADSGLRSPTDCVTGTETADYVLPNILGLKESDPNRGLELL